MKRVALHVLFWLAYLSQNILLIFLVNASRLPDAQAHDLSLAVANCLALLLPKLLLSYFMLYVILPNMASKSWLLQKGLLFSILAIFGTLLLYRAVVVFFVNPVIYHWPVDTVSFADPLGFLVALMDIGFASGYAMAIKQMRLRFAEKEREKQLIREKFETELKYLKNQIQPHFLFNTLNNIYALARKKSEDTPEVVMKLSKLLRFMLYETKKPLIRIEDEIKMLDDYIELERIRYGERLTLQFTKEIEDENAMIAPLILLPFVENAFKHGASESRYCSKIEIALRIKNDVLRFSIVNTREEDRDGNKDEKIGLVNVRRQLELMYQEHELKVNASDSLFEISLLINLKSYAKY